MAISYDWYDVKPRLNTSHSTTRYWAKLPRNNCVDREGACGTVGSYQSLNWMEYCGNGTAGNSVKLIQEKLNIAMFKARNAGQSTPYPGDISQDGIFGTQTDTVVRWFQTKNALYPVDGIVGSGTWNILKNA